MKNLLLILVSLLLTRCAEDTERPDAGTRLASITYEQNDEAWTQTFNYSPNGQLISTVGVRGEATTEVVYNDDLVTELITTETISGDLQLRDSVAYNADGTVGAVYTFSGSADDLDHIHWYT